MTALNLTAGGTPFETPVIVGPGSAASPAIAVRSLASGLWSSAEGSLSLAAGGVTGLTVTSTGLSMALPILHTVANTLTATAGGTQAAALALTASINRITVCATGGDSVRLPVSVAGMKIVVINDGAAAAQVFGAGTDTIDAVATATGVVLTNARRAEFWCVVAGLWQSGGMAKTT